MSQYLSSFIIDPVVRQARRFSRPSFGARSSPGNGNNLATASSVTEDDPARIDSHDHPQQAIVGDSEVVDDDENADHGTFGGESPLRLVEVGNLEPAVHARRYTVQHATLQPYGSHDGISSAADQHSNSAQSSSSMWGARDPLSHGLTLPDIEGEDEDTAGIEATTSRSTKKSLPEDDGMSQMRRRILAIQRADSSNEIKARLIYGVMTEKHNASHHNLHVRTRSPASLQSSERPLTPASPRSWESLRPTVSPPTSSSSAGDSSNPFHLAPDDLKPTYWENPTSSAKESEETEKNGKRSEEEDRLFGCAHYKRNIKLQCSACSKWYTCRFCHDEMEDHMLNRRETKMMLCMFCWGAQPASNACIFCDQIAAWYYCDICKLWDDDPEKDIYHCNDCGICRIGKGIGKDFFHCMKCNVCMAVGLLDKHRCVERSTDCDCPICNEYMFTSPEAVVFMPCGHSIHKKCYNDHMRTSYRCPICSRSITNMERQFLALRRTIEDQPMPEEFRDTKALIYCNDCTSKTTVQYHWLGLRCEVCDSYNTLQLSLRTDRSQPQSPPSPSTPLNDPLPTQAPPRQFPIPFERRILAHRPLRAVASLPTLTNPFSASLAFPPLPPRRDSNHASPVSAAFRFGSSSTSDADSSSSSDGEDEVDEYSDVDFWGGESPRLLSYSSPVQRPQDVVALDDENSEDSEDEEEEDDEDMNDDDVDDEGDEEAEGGEPLLDRMEIFGHR